MFSDMELKTPKPRGGANKYEPEHQTMLDGVTLFQARWRGLRTRRQLQELKYVRCLGFAPQQLSSSSEGTARGMPTPRLFLV